MVNVIRDSLLDLVVMLRNNLTDPAQRPTGTTESWVVSNQGTVSMTQAKVKNVRSVELNGTSLLYRTDYTVDYINRKILFTNLVSGTVDANYDYGSSWIYPQFPRLEDVTLPRISITQIGPSQIDLTVGASNILYEFTEQIDIWTDRSASYTFKGEPCSGPKLRDFIADELVEAIKDKRLWIPNTLDMRITTMVPSVEEVTRKNKPARTVFRARFDVFRSHFWGGGS